MQATPGSAEDPTVIDVVILNSYFWTTAVCVKNIKIAKYECVCVREAVNALYSDCSPQSKPIYSEANSHGQGSKQTRCLISFGSRRVSAQGRLIL